MFVPPARARPQRTMLMSKRKVGEGGEEEEETKEEEQEPGRRSLKVTVWQKAA